MALQTKSIPIIACSDSSLDVEIMDPFEAVLSLSINLEMIEVTWM